MCTFKRKTRIAALRQDIGIAAVDDAWSRGAGEASKGHRDRLAA